MSPTGRPRVALGMPLHRSADLLPEALDSIARQTYRSFRIALVDEGVDPAVEEAARAFAARCPEAAYQRNARPLGLVGNWRRAFDCAAAAAPEAEYFAWLGDHDRWEPGWLERLVAELDANKDAVLAYPHADAVSETGAPLPWRPRELETRGVAEPEERMERAMRGISAGWAVYGLFRVDALRRCGTLRRVILPDRMLVAEASLHGPILQVPEQLWSRRYRGTEVSSYARQRRTLFGARPPWHAHLPWWPVQAGLLAWRLGVHGDGFPAVPRSAAPRVALRYLAAAWRYTSEDQGLLKNLRTSRKRWRRRRKRVRKLAVAAAPRPLRRAVRRLSRPGTAAR